MKDEPVPVMEITNKDIEDLRRALKGYKGHKHPFHAYLLDLKTVSMRGTIMTVHDPEGFNRLNRINSKLELRQYYEDQDHFAAFPEAKEAQLKRIADLRKGLASKMKI